MLKRALVLACLAAAGAGVLVGPTAAPAEARAGQGPGAKKVDCSCSPDAEIVAFPWTAGCFTEVFVVASPLQAGKCNKPGCVSDNCQWTWAVDTFSLCGEPQFFVNGALTDPAAIGTVSWDYDPATGAFGASGVFKLECSGSGAVALGFGGTPFVEIDFGCLDCPSQ